jgi:drug/metabolite transporter (DMT)-like permease
MTERARARWQVLAAAALFSTGGALIKLCSLGAWQIAAFRSLFAAAFLLLFPAARRGWTWRTLLVATTYAGTLILFVQGNKLTTSANTIFLQSTAPIYLLLLGPWLLHEPVRLRDLVLLAAFGLGMALCFVGTQERFATAPNPELGNLLAALSGLGWAFTVLGIRWIARREGAEGGEASGAALAATAAGNLVAFVVCLPFALPVEGSTPQDWAILVALGVFQIGLAYVCLTAGLRHLRALAGTLLLLLEPVLNPIWAWLVHGERPGVWSLVGAAVIFSATAIHVATDRTKEAHA